MGDIAEPLGDVSQRYYLDASGNYVPILESQGVPGRVTTSITTYMGTVRDELERIRCPFPLYVNRATCGRKDLFLNYDRGSVLVSSRITNKTRSNNASREGTDATEQAFEINARQQNDYFHLTLAYQTSAEVNTLRDICFITDPTCAGACGPASAECSVGFMTAMAGAGVKAHVYYTLNGGATWTVCTADPFAINEDINSCECFYVTRGTVRVIVGRGTSDGANPPEIAYSDNYGTSWISVNLGAVVAEYIHSQGSLFALDYRHIWASTNVGKLWFSDDGGVTWTLKLTSSIVNGIYSIRFRDETYGLISGGHLGTGCILYSTADGGETWTLLTANLPAAEVAVSSYACDLVDNNRLWLSYTNAHLYYSNDAGLTWTRRYLPTPVGMTTLFCAYSMQFLDQQCGFIGIRCTVGAVAYGVLFRTFDGGFNWESWVGSAAAATMAISGIHPCSYNKCYWVGGPVAALGTVAIVSG
jgi:photosystem II stability/assembly factor-like uncharacterized protein